LYIATFQDVTFCDDTEQGGGNGQNSNKGKGNNNSKNNENETQDESGPLYLQSGIYRIANDCTLNRSIIAAEQSEILVFLENGANLDIPANLSVDLKPYDYNGIKIAFFGMGESDITSTGNSTLSAPGVWYLPYSQVELTGTVSANFELDCAQLFLDRFDLVGTIDVTMACRDNVTTGGDTITSSNLVFLIQ
jgi:hypothetical protein